MSSEATWSAPIYYILDELGRPVPCYDERAWGEWYLANPRRRLMYQYGPPRGRTGRRCAMKRCRVGYHPRGSRRKG